MVRKQREPSWSAVVVGVNFAVQSFLGFKAAIEPGSGVTDFFAAIYCVAFGAAATFILSWHACWLISRLRSGRTRMRVQPDTKPAIEPYVFDLTKKLKAPDAGPDQCPVCALDDLPYWRDRDDATVPYGRFDAHWTCAAWLPYVEPIPVKMGDVVLVNGKVLVSEDEIDREITRVAFEIDGHRTYAFTGMHTSSKELSAAHDAQLRYGSIAHLFSLGIINRVEAERRMRMEEKITPREWVVKGGF